MFKGRRAASEIHAKLMEQIQGIVEWRKLSYYYQTLH